MLTKQANNQIDFSKNSIVLPEQVECYLHDKNDYSLIPSAGEKIVVPRELRDVVKKSDLFSKEDKEGFVFE